MKSGVVYWNHGERCLVRLLVSLRSLRRHYVGPVAILNEGEPPPWFRAVAEKLTAKIKVLPVNNDYGLVKKARLWRVVPFDVTLFLDSDTVIRGNVQPLLDATAEHGLVVTNFCGWETNGRRMSARVREWAKVDAKLTKKALAYGPAVNTGVQGWAKGCPALTDYEALTARGLAAGVGKKTLDELAMQLVITKHPHELVGPEWNCSSVYGDLDKAKIVHYHGHKHCRVGKAGDLWKAEFWKLVEAFPEYRKELRTSKDSSVRVWLEEAAHPGRIKDMTIVTAVNPKYADRLKANLAKWMQTPGLKEQKFLVFVNGFGSGRARRWLDLPNVRVVRWDYPGASVRETMLAAFVLGVAEHVKTDYWLKLDADAKPVAPEFKWPRFRRAAVTSQKWGYTKMKGDPDATEHWFNKLDRLYAGKRPLFKRKLDPKADFKVSHRRGNPDRIPLRFASFCHIERTDFTRRMARACGNRLPIPSHDTLAWYFATLWAESVKLVNMKSQVVP